MLCFSLKFKNICETKFHNKNLDLLILPTYSERYVKIYFKNTWSGFVILRSFESHSCSLYYIYRFLKSCI